MASTFLVIGLGRFGTNLALRLMDSGNEVLVIDSDEEAVSRIAPPRHPGQGGRLHGRGGAALAGPLQL